MLQIALKPKINFWFYRLSTIAKSFKTLYTLPQEKIDAFMNSYIIYDHDWSNEEALLRTLGKDYYEEIKKKLIDYYSVLNHLCAIGQVEKMYIPPAMDLNASIIQNQKLFEKKMAKDLTVGKGSKVLDIGCGRGRVAAHVASLTSAEITGINIDPDQLDSARRYALGNGLSEQCKFRQGDLNDLPLPFEDSSLDGVYQIQVFSLSKHLEKLFADLYRVLKPGGRFACLDWMCLDKYDPKNPEHLSLMKKIKPLIGAIGTLPKSDYVDLLKKVGFKILISENPSQGGNQAPLIETADKFYTKLYALIRFFVTIRLLPKHFKTLFDRLTKDGEVLIEADRKGLVTTCYYIVAEKP